jgi:hypothetical protein
VRALLDGIRLALRAIVCSPLRASLTVLGILIGVSAVVTVAPRSPSKTSGIDRRQRV